MDVQQCNLVVPKCSKNHVVVKYMLKKYFGLIGIGVVIGVFGVSLFWYAVNISELADPDYCEFVEYVILSEYNMIYNESGEASERAIINVKYYTNSWEEERCVEYNSGMASVIEEINEDIERLP